MPTTWIVLKPTANVRRRTLWHDTAFAKHTCGTKRHTVTFNNVDNQSNQHCAKNSWLPCHGQSTQKTTSNSNNVPSGTTLTPLPLDPLITGPASFSVWIMQSGDLSYCKLPHGHVKPGHAEPAERQSHIVALLVAHVSLVDKPLVYFLCLLKYLLTFLLWLNKCSNGWLTHLLWLFKHLLTYSYMCINKV